jgi:hypothetical protein
MVYWDAEKIACLKQHWAAGTPKSTITKLLGAGWAVITAMAEELGLGPPPARLNGRENLRGALEREHRRGVGPDLRHRRALNFSSPVRVKPATSLIGAPVKTLDPETQALIDAALAKRAGA